MYTILYDLNHEWSNIAEIVTNIDFLYSFMLVGVNTNTIYHMHCACGQIEESANNFMIKIVILCFYTFFWLPYKYKKMMQYILISISIISSP